MPNITELVFQGRKTEVKVFSETTRPYRTRREYGLALEPDDCGGEEITRVVTMDGRDITGEMTEAEYAQLYALMNEAGFEEAR
jgi:hypothetical protein